MPFWARLSSVNVSEYLVSGFRIADEVKANYLALDDLCLIQGCDVTFMKFTIPHMCMTHK